MPKTIVVLGARNLGGAIVDHFQASAGTPLRSLRARTRSKPWLRAGHSRSRPTRPT